MAIERYTDITADDNQRYNDIVRRITNGETISADDALFYGEFNAAFEAYSTELQAQFDAIMQVANAKIAELAETERVAREGYNAVVNAALARYERVRGEVNG